MTLGDVAIKHLLRQRAKAIFVLAGLLTGVATFVALSTITSSMTAHVNKRLEKYGANMLILPKMESLSLSYGGMSVGGVSLAEAKIEQSALEGLKHIKNAANIAAVGPMVLGAVSVGKSRVLLAGVDFKALKVLRPWWRIKGARPGENGLIAGFDAARVLGLTLGRRVIIEGRPLTVTGVLAATGSQDDSLLFTPLTTAQAILKKPGLLSLVEVAALCNACPIDEMVIQIKGALPGMRVVAISQVVKGRMATLGHFRRLSMAVSMVVALVSALVVLTTMMGSVRERTAEIGIMRAIGYRRSHVFKVVLIEAAVLSALAGAIGYGAGMAVAWGALPFVSAAKDAALAFNPLLLVIAVALAVGLGLLASLYPARVAARLDPNEALRAL